jgi:hypothetical protein
VAALTVLGPNVFREFSAWIEDSPLISELRVARRLSSVSLQGLLFNRSKSII